MIWLVEKRELFSDGDLFSRKLMCWAVCGGNEWRECRRMEGLLRGAAYALQPGYQDYGFDGSELQADTVLLEGLAKASEECPESEKGEDHGD